MESAENTHPLPGDIAIIGLAGRFPGALNVEEFWKNLLGGVESIRRYSEAELRSAGVSDELLANPNFVRAGAPLAGIDQFDASFFGLNPKDASIMDPQHRQFLECAWEALENAGYSPEGFKGLIGVFSGCGPNSYFIYNLLTAKNLVESEGVFALRHTGNDKDLLATRVSYQLDLRGPSINVQTACSSSLVAVHLACQSLLSLESDLALAGAVSIEVPHGQGYIYREGEVLSSDGRCRAFDAASSGTVFGSGTGIVVLRRLEEAVAAGDTIYSVIKGSAVNNDGSRKVGYLAPSVEGQIEAIRIAQQVAEVEPSSIDYIESHGTGTRVGDPIEIAALGEVFRGRDNPLLVGAVKTNIGHLDAASGIAGLIKTTLALRSGSIPPTLHYTAPNPLADFAKASIRIVDHVTQWPEFGRRRRAGVTSLGIGGTNAHVILEEPPPIIKSTTRRDFQLMPVSARSPAALDEATRNLARHLRQNPDISLADAAYTLRVGRRQFSHRRTFLCRDLNQARQAMETPDSEFVSIGEAGDRQPRMAFLFPGQGTQHVGMGRDLYDSEPIFREWVDRCAELAELHLGLDLRQVLYPSGQVESAADLIWQTWNTQPILFAVEYALAKLWMSWGVLPSSLLGHSIGEYVAACLGGVFSLEDAVELVCVRGLLMRELRGGTMLAIGQSESDVARLVNETLSIAAVNGPDQCVVAGATIAIEELEGELMRRGVPANRLHTSHAFHSHMMDPVLSRFEEAVSRVTLRAPEIPLLSNVTGSWMTPAEATDPQYWVKQLRHTVRFHEGLAVLLADPRNLLLEVGPGAALTSIAKQRGNGTSNRRVYQSLPRQHELRSSTQVTYGTLGKLWANGVRVDWESFDSGESRKRIPLPTYPFEKQRHWIGPPFGTGASQAAKPMVEDWFYRPTWQEIPPTAAATGKGPWLLFTGSNPLGESMRKELQRQGADVKTVTYGERFAQHGPDSFVANPSNRDDFRKLLDLLPAVSLLGKIVWLWPLDEGVASQPPLALSFHALLSFTQLLMPVVRDRVDLCVVTDRAVSVHGERVIHPGAATVAGICRVAPKECLSLRCVHIDVDDSDDSTTAKLVVQEASTESSHDVVAYRAGTRWVESIERYVMDPHALGRGPGRLRQGGVYLITGAFGGLGLEVAAWLARDYRARLIMVSRDAESRSQEYRAELENFERAGSEVLTFSVDIADRESLQRVLAGAQERFGPVQGVFHAAGILDDGIIQLKSPAAATNVLRPKVEGTEVLNDLFRGAPVDFVVLFSSISSIRPPAGQVDYCAANAYLNAFADSQPAEHNTVSIGWPAWRETGMAARSDPGAKFAHPLIERIRTKTDTELVFAGTLSLEKHWVLREHRFRGGDALLPGTAHLELAIHTMRQRNGGDAIVLENFTFLEPFRVAPGSPAEFHATLRLGSRGFEYSTSFDGGRFASGQVSSLPNRELKIDLKAIAARCSAMEEGLPRNLRQERHFEFGRHWKNLRHISFGTEECLASLELPSECQKETTQYWLHPALLDMATGVALFLIPGFKHAGDLLLPFSYRRFTVYGRLPSRVLSYARVRAFLSSDLASFDITIAAEDGSVIVEAEEFVVKRITSHEALAVRRNPLSSRSSLSEEPSLPAEARERISTAEGLEALKQILASPVTGVIFVSSKDLCVGVTQSEPGPVLKNDMVVRGDDTAGALCKMWQRVLGLDDVGLDVDFFDAGGHSLAALRLFTEINQHFGLKLGLATIFEARTVRALSSLIEGKCKPPALDAQPVFESLVPIQPHGSKPPLFCVHAVGGNVLNYQELARNLGMNQPVYGMQSRGLLGHAPVTSVEQMATDYIREIRTLQSTGPYFVCGKSFGGLVAYEIGRQLRQQGQAVGLVALIDTFQQGLPPETSAFGALAVRLQSYATWGGFHFRRLVFGTDRVTFLKASIRNGMRKIRALLYRQRYRRFERSGAEMPVVLQDVQNANWIAARTYTPRFYDGTVVLFRCKIRTGGYDPDYSMGWKHLVRGSFRVVDVPGDHGSMMTSPGLEILASEMVNCLRQASEVGR